MNKEVKELIDSLKDSVENPVFGKDIDGEGIDNFVYFTPKESKMLLDYINQLETNRNEAIELLSKGVTFCENDSQGNYDICNIAINREKKAIEILERGKE